MAITKSIVKKICLSLIGGSPLIPIPTTKILGGTTVTQLTPKTLQSFVTAATQVTQAIGTLSAIVQNPVGEVLSTVQTTVGDLVKENFSQLDSTLPIFASASDTERVTAFLEFKKALGGGDGIGGCFSELVKFKDHTDRISGVKVASDSDLSLPLTNPQTPGGR